MVGGLEGHYYPELYRPDCIAVDDTVRAARENADLVRGIKGHAEIGGFTRWGDEAMRRAAEIGRALDLPLYIHFGQLWPLPERQASVRCRRDPAGHAGDPAAGRHPGASLHAPSRRLRRPARQGASDGARGAGARAQDRRRPRLALLASRWRGWCSTPASCPTRWAPTCTATTPPSPSRAARPRAHPDKEEMHMFAGAQNFSLASAMTSMLALGLTLEQVVPMVTQQLRRDARHGGRDRHAEARASRPTSRCWPTSAAASCCRTTRTRRSSPSISSGRSSACAPASASTADARDPAPAAAGRRRMTRRAEAGSASARRSAARRTRASCTAAAASSATSRRPGMLEVAFLRSPVAHARLRGVDQARGRREARVHARRPAGRADRSAPTPRCRASASPSSRRWRAASCAMSARRSPPASPRARAEAEDLAAACELDYEALPAVHDMLAAPLPGSPLVHEHWSMNAFLETRRDDDVSGLDAIAAAKVDAHACAPRASAWRRSRAGACWPNGIRGSSS